MDISTPIAVSTISHWTWKSGRFNVFRDLLALAVIFRPILTSLLTSLNASNHGITLTHPIFATWVATSFITSYVTTVLLLIEYLLVSNTEHSTFISYINSLEREIFTQNFIILIIAVLQPFHSTQIKRVLDTRLATSSCELCITNPLTARFLDTGRIYIDETFATIATVLSIWCISSHMAYCSPKSTTILLAVYQYLVYMALVVLASVYTWQWYCSGEEVCLGNMAVAAWSLVWVPVGKTIGHFKSWIRMVGSEAVRNHHERVGWIS